MIGIGQVTATVSNLQVCAAAANAVYSQGVAKGQNLVPKMSMTWCK